MKQMTELSEKPPVYSVTNDNGAARIRFFENVEPIERDGETLYIADMWEMSCPWQDSLQSRVEENPAVWLAKIKAITEKEEAAKRLEELKTTATDDAVCDLADIVADLVDAVTELAGMIG